MKFPSFQNLLLESKNTFIRFPFELLAAILGTLVWIYYIQWDLEKSESIYQIKFLLTCLIGLVVFLSGSLFSESQKLGNTKWIIQVGITILLIIYYFTFGNELTDKDVIRFFLLCICFHLIVSFAGYIGNTNLISFWQFNESIFLRILTAGLFSAALFVGLAGALAALQALFEIEITHKRYLQLFTSIAGVFNTWFFLAGVPKEFPKQEKDILFPKGLKVFTQYILIPLVVIYLLILYSYEAKIMVTWTLPKGWVSYLVIGYGIVGILSILLVYPVRNKEGNKWINIFSKWFYLAIFPLVILLIIAIGTRVMQYGITENRYFIVALSVWLAFIATFFLFNKRQNIKVIPVSLSILTMLACWGPQSAFSISELSQMKRLKNLLEKHALLVDGKIKKASSKISFEDEKDISGIVEYLKESHGIASLQPLYTQNLTSLNLDKYSGSDTLVKLMGLNYVSPWSTQGTYSKYYRFSTDVNMGITIKDYDYLIDIAPTYSTKKVTVEEHIFEVLSLEKNKGILKVKISNGEEFQFDILNLARQLRSKNKVNETDFNTSSQDLSIQTLSLKDSTSFFSSTLILTTLQMNINIDKQKELQGKITDCAGILLIKKRQ